MHADRLAPRPDVAVPAQRRRLLDRDPRGDRRRQHLVAVVLVLLVEEVPGRQADDARAHAVGDQLLVRLDRERDLAAGRDQDQLGVAVRRVGEHVAAAAQALGGGVLRAVEHRHVLAGEHERAPAGGARSIATRQASATSLASQGRITLRPGIARSEASCSTGWWVGPVLAEPDRVVGEEVDHRQLHQRREPDRRPRVVGEGRGRSTTSGRSFESESPLRDRRRLVLADPVVELAAAAVAGLEVAGARRTSSRTEVESVRSAEPVTQPGHPLGDRVLDLRCEALRVAIPFSSASKLGISASQPSGSSRRCIAVDLGRRARRARRP